MKSPQVTRNRMASGGMAQKSPARARSSKKNKENMGLSAMACKVRKSKDTTKVRPVPDFGKLHKKWENQLNENKAQAKKPLTVVHEFDFTRPGMKRDHVPLKQLNKQTSKIEKDHGFKTDRSALTSITSNQGIRPLQDNNSRMTLASMDFMKAEPIGDFMKAEPIRDFMKTEPIRDFMKTEPKKEVPDCERDSFGTLANIQQQFGINFEEDKTALKSILDSTGVSDHDLADKAATSAVAACTAQPSAVRQTIGGSSFKAPAAVTPQATRGSMYYTGSKADQFSKQFVYSEFARRMASRLTMDSNTAKTLPKEVLSPAVKVVQQRHSIYVNVEYSSNRSKLPGSPSKEIRNDPKTPMSERKAQRILRKTPSKSPAGRLLSKSTSKKNLISKWAEFLGPRTPVPKDSVQVKLFEDDGENYQDENEPLATKLEDDTNRLKEIEEVEKKLQKEIEEMERKKRSTNQPTMVMIDKDSPAYNRPAPSTPSKQPSRPASDSSLETNRNVPTTSQQQMVGSPKPTKKRMVLGELNDQEITVRSSPSYREKGRSRSKVKSAPTFASCVFGEENSCKVKKVNFQTPNVLKHPESPSARYHKNCASPKSSGDVLMESPKASRLSSLKRTSRYSPIGRSSSKARDYSPTSRLRDNQVYNIMVELDKENCSPVRPILSSKKPNVVVTPSKKTTITEEEDEFIVEYDVLEQSIQDMSIQDINQTMSESVVAMEDLKTEAESLMEKSNLDETASNTIMDQLELIQKKQQELQAIQNALQQRLEQRKKKKKLNFDVTSKKQQIQGIKKQEVIKPAKDVANEVPRNENKEATKTVALQNKKHLSERNVVDVSPISLGPSNFGNGFGSNVFLTPEHNAEENEFDYENSPTLFPIVNNTKNQTLRQPLHSTAHESQHQAKLDESSSMIVSPVNEGGALSQGLLQMAQHLNATPHKNMHWKKQLLTSNDSNDQGHVQSSNNENVPEDSFYENGDNVKTPLAALGNQTPVRCMRPIGTPFSFSDTATSNVLRTPVSQRRTPTLAYSPKSLFSGSAQLLTTSPIQTPLAMRDAFRVSHAVGSSRDATPVSSEEISIDASPELTGDIEGKVRSPQVTKNMSSPSSVKKLTPVLLKSPGSLSLAANLIAMNSPTAFKKVVRSRPVMCNEVQGSLLSKVRGKYMDALVDDEVSLYNSRLQMASKMSFGIRCSDPVSKILQEGDEFHFIPIVEIKSPPRIVPSIGSAFTSSAFRQIRV